MKTKIIIVAIILIALAGIFFAKQDGADTSDWVTYRNEELGFEVKHPAGWDVRREESESAGGPAVSINFFEGEVQQWGVLKYTQKGDARTVVEKEEELVKAMAEFGNLEIDSKITDGVRHGMDGVTYTIHIKTEEEDRSSTGGYINHDGYVWVMAYSLNGVEDPGIGKTFRFLE